MIRLPFLLAAVLAAAPAAAQPAPAPQTQPAAPASKLDERLAAVVNRPGGLQAEDVAKRAEETSFSVRARQEEVRAAEAAVSQAKAAYLPKVDLVARYTRVSDSSTGAIASLVAAPSVTEPGPIPPGTELVNVPLEFPVVLNNYVMQGTLTVPISDYFLRIPQANTAARHGADAARFNERASRRQTGLDGRVLYYQWAQAKLQTVVAEQALESAREHLSDVKKQANVGVASNADVLAVEAQVASAELLLLRSKNLASLLETQLRTVTHDESGRPYEIGEDLTQPIAGGTTAAPADDDQAAARRPEARALSEAAAAQRTQAKIERAGALPRLDAVAHLDYANPNQRVFPSTDEFNASWDVSVQLSWTPTDVPSSLAAKRAALARAAQLDAQRAELVDGVKIQITQAQIQVSEADAAVGTSQRGLAAAEEAYRVRRVLFQNGKATNVELTDAETEMTRARLEAIDARVSQRVARARLAFALGQ
jgi:outer membrane protein